MITKEKQEDNEANLDVTTSQHSWTTDEFLLAVDLHLQLDTIYNTASLRLLHLNAGQIASYNLTEWLSQII